jgi:predicted MPP superfamily phosphohydrolase
MAEDEAADLQAVVEQPVTGTFRLTRRISREWWGVLGLPLLLASGLVYLLPRLLRQSGAPGRAKVVRQAGLQALGWGGVDLAAMAGLPLLRLSYDPVRAAFLNLLGGRAAISGAATALALASRLFAPDLSPAGVRGFRRALWAVHGAVTALIVYATYIEGQRLQVTRTALAFPGRTPGAPPVRFRLAHLSDIHVERLTHRDEAMLSRLKQARPDLILLTGDYLNIDYYDKASYATLRALMAGLAALAPRYGVYGTLGNNDPPAETRAALDETGVRLLDTTVVCLEIDGRQVQIVGVRTNEDADWQVDLPRFRAAVAQADAAGRPDLRILLYHMPDLAPQAANADVDLYLCGHTHGGQIRLPLVGALRTASRFGKRYVIGLNRLPNGGYIHTSRGTGFEGMGIPRARVLCPPEVALFDVTVGAGLAEPQHH